MPQSIRSDRESMAYDVVIVGAGPAGLSCAIRLKQIDQNLNICILEKGSEVGAHILSGAVIETRALDELFPEWKGMDNLPALTRAKRDLFLLLSSTLAFRLPLPALMKNNGNFIGSLGNLSRWLADQAEGLGVEIFPGFAAAEVLYNEDGAVIGVATGDLGINAKGEKTERFEPGMELHARQIVLAEGCHGSLSKTIIEKFDLRAHSNPQTYGIGIKEIWEIEPHKYQPGSIVHSIGWPMDKKTYGGSWIYHMENNQVSIGFVVGLDYENPYLDPFQEMQRFKTHPAIQPLLEGGRRIAYGARALVEGGLQSLPKLSFPGGVLIGDSAGFLNVPKIKGIHTSMKSGMVAAESIAALLSDTQGFGLECTAYPTNIKASWIWKELKKVRNIRPGFRGGLWLGLINAAFESLTAGLSPWTFKNRADHAQLKKADKVKEIIYPKPDGQITFDKLSSVALSGTHHEEDQPCHLQLKDPSISIGVNLPVFAEPAQRYCPAGVYEIVQNNEGQYQLQINARNCVHCKTCDIKDPSQNIDWTVPSGGDGPNYPNM